MDPPRLTLADLVAGLGGGPLPGGLPAVEIRRAVIDSRQATPGSLFIALRGQRRDGHDFIADAIARGAVAVIAERAWPECKPVAEWADLQICKFANCHGLIVPDSLTALQQAAAYWRRQHDVRVIGVTGSVGKTTSKEMIAAVLRQRYRTLKSQGNYNNEIGLPLTLLHLTADQERVVLEMGMYALGEIAQLAEIARPQVGVVTNVGPTHLERLGTLARIAQAKAELPRALPPAEEGGVAILNADDERVRAMADLTPARVFTYGLSPDADLWADEIESAGLEGVRFRLHHRGESLHVRTPMLGRHSVHTALCAAAVGLVEGLSWEEIVGGLQDQTAQLRLTVTPGLRGALILDDTYNSSPASCIAALNLLAELEGRKIAVLGDMYELGDYAEQGHRQVGRRARDVADRLITVGELGRIIAQEARAVGLGAEAVQAAATNKEAIALLRDLLEPGDVVLVKGSRGVQMEEIVQALAAPRQEGAP